MATLPGGKPFDSNQYEDMRSFKVIPKGKYPAQIIASEMKKTKAGTGEYLELQIEIISGEFKSQRIWAILNLINQNPVAVDIANREFATICRATGVLNPTDSAQLHKIPFTACVGVEPAQGQYPEKNKIVGYESYDGSLNSVSTDSMASSPGGSIVPDWENSEANSEEDSFDHTPSQTEKNEEEFPY